MLSQPAAWALAVATALTLVVLLSLWLPVEVKLSIDQRGADTDGTMHVRYFFGLFRLNRKLVAVSTTATSEGPSIAFDHANPKNQDANRKGRAIITLHEVILMIREWRIWRDALERGLWITKKLLQKTRFKQVDLQCTFGFADPIVTGMTYGLTWSVLTTALGVLSRHSQFEQRPGIGIHCAFQPRTFEFHSVCILQVRAGNAMLAGIRMLRLWVSLKRRRRNGTSHSRTHEDSNGEYSRHG